MRLLSVGAPTIARNLGVTLVMMSLTSSGVVMVMTARGKAKTAGAVQWDVKLELKNLTSHVK